MAKRKDLRIEALANDFRDGKLSKGLTAKRKLGSDYHAVLKAACQLVPKAEETEAVEPKSNNKRAVQHKQTESKE